MLVQRLLSSVIGIPLAVAVIWAGGTWLAGVLCLLAMIGLWEFHTKARGKGIVTTWPVACAAIVAFVMLAWGLSRPEGDRWWVSLGGFGLGVMCLLFGLMLLVLVWNLVRFHRDQSVHVVMDVGATLLIALYIGVPFSMCILLRELPGRSHAEPVVGLPTYPIDIGARLLLLAFATASAADSAAYFAGTTWGRHKLTPASPNKTVEGFVGGMVGAVVTATVIGLWFRVPFHVSAVSGVVVGTFGQLGDLCKSILKRDLGTKDFGNLIPGHGGILDRLDSLMMSAPLLFVWAWLTG